MNQKDNRFSLDNMLKTTAKQLGTTPEALKQAAQNGNLDKIIQNQPQSDKMKKVLSDPKEAQKMLDNPAVKKDDGSVESGQRKVIQRNRPHIIVNKRFTCIR